MGSGVNLDRVPGFRLTKARGQTIFQRAEISSLLRPGVSSALYWWRAVADDKPRYSEVQFSREQLAGPVLPAHRTCANPTKLRFLILIVMVFSFLYFGCNPRGSPDFAFIDGYLGTWDEFAQGNNELIPRIREDTATFERYLAYALRKRDPRAPSRLVFYAIVQVGGFIPLESPLGQAFQQSAGDNVPVSTSGKDGKHRYFAGDLYFWWEAHKFEYPPYPLYDEWRQRKFARNGAIPMYKGTTKSHE